MRTNPARRQSATDEPSFCSSPRRSSRSRPRRRRLPFLRRYGHYGRYDHYGRERIPAIGAVIAIISVVAPDAIIDRPRRCPNARSSPACSSFFCAGRLGKDTSRSRTALLRVLHAQPTAAAAMDFTAFIATVTCACLHCCLDQADRADDPAVFQHDDGRGAHAQRHLQLAFHRGKAGYAQSGTRNGLRLARAAVVRADSPRARLRLDAGLEADAESDADATDCGSVCDCGCSGQK